MNLQPEIASLEKLSWRVACAMDYAKSLSSKGSYETGNLEVLEQNLKDKIKDLKKRLENKDGCYTA